MRHALQINALKSVRSWWTRRADRVIVPSRYLARWVQGWGVPEDRITVIYNAVEPVNGIRPAVVPLKTPVKLVTLGRLVSWKRVDQIIEAITKLDQAGLVIIGDGPERSRLEEQAFRVGTADRVSFAGQRNNAEAMALMAACDIFVLNSTYEGFPFVVLEAMSLGLPVVGTAAGGTPN
jgi:glycosyltransferase involved in cell wall biosynthesis